MAAKHATLLPANASGLSQAGEMLRKGQLVAFPTETVYGLGANALDSKAVHSIFSTKGRPLTDPLIVHVLSFQDALDQHLVTLAPRDLQLASFLADRFWPGPLTLVLKANEEVVPRAITANTGMIGIRVPAHPIARDLLQSAGVPVSAPSANRFGHVSPTSASHVMHDLGAHPIGVVDGGDCNHGACSVGIESSVLQIHGCVGDRSDGEDRLVLFRKGGVSEKEIRKAFSDGGLADSLVIETPSKHVKHKPEDMPSPDVQGEAAPGQHITHYAPDVETFLVMCQDSSLPTAGGAEVCDTSALSLSDAAVIDFGGALSHLQDRVLGYKDLSKSGSTHEAANQLFDVLRWSESVAGAKHVFVAELVCDDEAKSEHLEAVKDRMYRAASGKLVDLAKLA